MSADRKDERPLIGWAVLTALSVTVLAALGFFWLRERSTASERKPPAHELRLRLDINSASAEELDLLPGVGASRAAKLVEARSRRGGFKRLAELDEPGLLGAGASARLEPYLEPLPGDSR